MKKKSTREMISRQIYSELFPSRLSKGDIRRKEILEGAVQAYASIDHRHLSYDDIAKPAKTIRKLVQHYFPDKNDLYSFAMKLIRAQYQAYVVEEISKAKTADERFEAYIRSAIQWPKVFPVHVRAWFLNYLVCSQNHEIRSLHADLVRIGEERIIALVREMTPNLKMTAPQSRMIAKTAQRLITGALIEICTERDDPSVRQIQDEVLRTMAAVIESCQLA